MRAAAWLLHTFADYWRFMFRHVRHALTGVLCDSASDVKLLMAGYEVGWLAQRPAFEDIVVCINNDDDDSTKGVLPMPHPISHVKFIIWGYNRTRGKFTGKKAQAPSDTEGRLNAMNWLALGWNGMEVVGGFQLPGVSGGSAQGKMPTASDLVDDLDEEDCVDDRISAAYAVRRRNAAAALRSADTLQAMQAAGTLRSIFNDWVQVQRLQACDYAALTGFMYKYTTPTGILEGPCAVSRCTTQTRVMWHICGEPLEPGRAPAWPADVLAEHAWWLQADAAGARRQYMCDPPAGLWPCRKAPKFPNNAALALEVLAWWARAKVPSSLYNLRPPPMMQATITKGKRKAPVGRSSANKKS